MRRGVLLAAALLVTGAQAQTVPRCEAADGTVTSADGPCPAGSKPVRSLAPTTAPSAAEQKAAQAERNRKAEETRLAREQEKAQARAKKQETHCRRLETRLRHAQEDLAGATLQRRTEAQRRVKRADKLYAEDCGRPRK
jgi:hypothetical protein